MSLLHRTTDVICKQPQQVTEYKNIILILRHISMQKYTKVISSIAQGKETKYVLDLNSFFFPELTLERILEVID